MAAVSPLGVCKNHEPTAPTAGNPVGPLGPVGPVQQGPVGPIGAISSPIIILWYLYSPSIPAESMCVTLKYPTAGLGPAG